MRSADAFTNLRASLALGVRAFPARTWAGAAWLVVQRWIAGSYWVPPGGSSVVGSMAYVAAARELALQVRAGEMPEPDTIVVAVGSGGTAAGLAAGVAAAGLETRVVGVIVATPAWAVSWLTRRMTRACAKRAGVSLGALVLDATWLGGGYGVPTEMAERAIRAAASQGVTLDATYTGKAFAAALDRVHTTRDANVLFWHTLSSAPMAPLLASAPAEDTLDPRVVRLLR